MAFKNFLHPAIRIPLVLGFLLLSFTACSGSPLRTAQITPTPIPLPTIVAKQTYTVQRGEMIQQLQFPGHIAPADEKALAFGSGGKVAKVYFQRGDAVGKGQLLADLVTGQSEYDFQRAQANLKIAQLRLELARLQTPRNSDTYTVTVAIQEQEVVLAQIAVDELTAAYNNARITSPITGTVTLVSIASGDDVQANTPVLSVADLKNLTVIADVPPLDLPQLAAGMKVTATAIGKDIPAEQGVIPGLPGAYNNSAGAGGNSVQVTLDQPPLSLGYAAGDTVGLTIVLQKKEDALWLPAQAVREFEGRYFVILQDGESQRRVDIKVGITEPDRVEVLEGLSEGQVVVAP